MYYFKLRYWISITGKSAGAVQEQALCSYVSLWSETGRKHEYFKKWKYNAELQKSTKYEIKILVENNLYIL